MGARNLNNLRVFIVEDESMVSALIEDMLADMGCAVVGVASNVEEAVAKFAEVSFDAAILDLNLNGSRSLVLAEKLAEMRVPFVLCTGYGSSGVPAGSLRAPLIGKPFQESDLRQALIAALDLNAKTSLYSGTSARAT
jgi:DNA-binding NtrC family response regulator